MSAPWEREIAAVRGYLLDALQTLREGNLSQIVDGECEEAGVRNVSDGWEVLRVRFAQAEERAKVCGRELRMAEVFSGWPVPPSRAYARLMRKAESLAVSAQTAVRQERVDRVLLRATEAIKALDTLEYQLGDAESTEAA